MLQIIFMCTWAERGFQHITWKYLYPASSLCGAPWHTFHPKQRHPRVSSLIACLSPAGAAVWGASQWTTRDQGGEREAEADEWRVSARAGAHKPGAGLGTGAAECAAGSVHTASRGEGDVSCSWSHLLRLCNSSPDSLASKWLNSCSKFQMLWYVEESRQDNVSVSYPLILVK